MGKIFSPGHHFCYSIYTHGSKFHSKKRVRIYLQWQSGNLWNTFFFYQKEVSTPSYTENFKHKSLHHSNPSIFLVLRAKGKEEERIKKRLFFIILFLKHDKVKHSRVWKDQRKQGKDFTLRSYSMFHWWVLLCTQQHAFWLSWFKAKSSSAWWKNKLHWIFNWWVLFCAPEHFPSVGVIIFQAEHNLFRFK